MSRVPRRHFLLTAGAMLAALPLRSGARAYLKRVAFFSEGRMEPHRPHFEAFLDLIGLAIPQPVLLRADNVIQ